MRPNLPILDLHILYCLPLPFFTILLSSVHPVQPEDLAQPAGPLSAFQSSPCRGITGNNAHRHHHFCWANWLNYCCGVCGGGGVVKLLIDCNQKENLLEQKFRMSFFRYRALKLTVQNKKKKIVILNYYRYRYILRCFRFTSLML